MIYELILVSILPFSLKASCPCGMTRIQFEKEFRKQFLITNKDKIIKNLPISRYKRAFLELNYTVNLEKVAKVLTMFTSFVVDIYFKRQACVGQ